MSYLKGITNVSQEHFHFILTLHCDLGKVGFIIFMFLNIKERGTIGLHNMLWVTYPNLQLSLCWFFIFSLLNINFRRHRMIYV